jgi:hypothetical protein
MHKKKTDFSCILSTYLEQLTGSHIKLYRSEVNRLRHLCLQKLLVTIPDKYTVDENWPSVDEI